jgi:hypothetical protein
MIGGASVGSRVYHADGIRCPDRRTERNVALRASAYRLALPAAGEKKARKREPVKVQKQVQKTQSPSRPVHAVLGGSSLPCSITEENRAIAKVAFLQKL